MIGIDSLVTAVVYLICIGLVFWLLWWLIDYCAPPEPFKKVATVLLAVLAVVVVIFVLLSLVGVVVFRP